MKKQEFILPLLQNRNVKDPQNRPTSHPSGNDADNAFTATTVDSQTSQSICLDFRYSPIGAESIVVRHLDRVKNSQLNVPKFKQNSLETNHENL